MKWSQPADDRVVEAVVRAFSVPADEADDGLYALLLPLSARQWQRSFYWLDASGMALYLLHHLQTLDILETLPPSIRTRLKQNLADNTLRSTSMWLEFVELNRAFQHAGIDYCNLKGFTLSPHSCPDPALRTQLDLDFLVDGKHLETCRAILSSRGYHLRGATSIAWEFKTDSNELATISNLYKPREQRTVELHFTTGLHSPTRDERLDRLHCSQRDELTFPTLAPADQFIGQATHILSHLCGPCTRLAWLVEFMNHILFRFHDQPFWDEVVRLTGTNRTAALAIGIASLTLRELFDLPIPADIEAVFINPLPEPIRLWTLNYAADAILADFPGTKLHLLLRNQLPLAPETQRASITRALVPLNRPPRILHVHTNAGLQKRLAAELYQVRYELFRARFHLTQGLAFMAELPRWHRILKAQQPTLQAVQKDSTLQAQVVQSQ